MHTAFLLALVGHSIAWYIPGLAPTDYAQNDKVPVLVNRLTSQADSEGRRSVLGIDYYFPSFQFCEPEDGPKPKAVSLGAILFGDRIYTSPMELEMLKEEECHHICTSAYDPQSAGFTARYVLDQYFQHWLVDGLPVGGVDSNDRPINPLGFPLGERAEDGENGELVVHVNNHFEFTIEYHHNQQTQKYRVVGASVKASSRNTHADENGKFSCSSDGKPAVLQSGASSPVSVDYSYSVKWVPSETPWGTRWDRYLQAKDVKLNWLSILTGSGTALCMAFICAMVFRGFRADTSHINGVDLGSEDMPDEVGWKLIGGDIYRAPAYPQLYAIAIGSGAQILASVSATVVLAVLGFVSPANRGSFTTALILLNASLGCVGGFVSATAYKLWGGTNWKTNLVLTPAVVPAMIFSVFFCINALLAFHGASGAVPLKSMLLLFLIWAVISVPLSMVYGFYGFKRVFPYQPNMRVNQIPRQIPPQPLRSKLWFQLFTNSLAPFAIAALQLRYIVYAMWHERVYYMFGFLFTTMWASLLLCVSMTLLSVFTLLRTENYHWQWRSFLVAGSPAFWVFIYFCVMIPALRSRTGQLLYLSYSLVLSILCFLAFGSAGAISSYFIVRRIYDPIKIE